MARGVTGGVDDADSGQDLCAMVEDAQPAAEEPDRLAGRGQVLSRSSCGLGARPERDLRGVREPCCMLEGQLA